MKIIVEILFLGLVSLLTPVCHCRNMTTPRTSWSPWSKCSTTCGFGIQIRVLLFARKIALKAQKPRIVWRRCMDVVCPSYLSRPRVHFSGFFIADTTTVNNVRCFFDPKNFCPNCNKPSVRLNSCSTSVEANGPQTLKYQTSYHSWNNMGGGHFYFRDTFVTSACWNSGKKCDLKDPLVGRKVENPHDGRIVDLDPDWQVASTIYALPIHIPGVLSAKMKISEGTGLMEKQDLNGRFINRNAKYKSRLTNITWKDSYFEGKFKHSKELSITFGLDQYNKTTKTGRITGTIGMTSSDDPQGFFGGRSMKAGDEHATKIDDVAFHVDAEQKVLTMDFSNWLSCPTDSSTYKQLTLAVKVPTETTHPGLSEVEEFSIDGELFLNLTHVGALDFLVSSSKWYTKYGGIVEINLDPINKYLLNIISQNQVGIIHTRSSDYHHDSEEELKFKILLLENKFGINFKNFGYFTNRLSVGKTWNMTVFATSFGRPLTGARVEMKLLKHSNYQTECIHKKKQTCSPFISTPLDAMQICKPQITNDTGFVQIQIRVVKNPGNPRKCGLDGQIYPYGLILTYSSGSVENVFRVGEGGMFSSIHNSQSSVVKAKLQCALDSVYGATHTAFKVYSSLPKSVMRKKCPSWTDDVKEIFYTYADVAPVMTCHNIINLKDIKEVRSKLKLVNMSMFGYDFDHPNFMPVTRDLSPDKTEIVRRWIECEMNGEAEVEAQARLHESIPLHFCDDINESIHDTLQHIQEILQLAMWVEFYTIPPYLTAYFSIKSENNQEVKKILRSIATEEMLHLSLASNLLNSIGGESDLTDLFWLPQYPTNFPSKNLIQVLPRLEIRLGKFSKELMRNIFSEIEKPSPCQVLSTTHSVALLWKALSIKPELSDQLVDENSLTSSWKKELLRENLNDDTEKFNGTDPGFLSHLYKFASQNLKLLHESDIDTIGGLYAYVMMHLIRTEACLKIKSPLSTIFTGNPDKQLRSALWYPTKGITFGKIFPVNDLRTALEAVLDITYEGEGGTPCSPFISNLAGPQGNPKITIESTSHFVKFQELAHGRKLAPISDNPPPWAEMSCLDHDRHCCSCISSNGSVHHSNSSACMRYCFAGASLSVDEANGVWPLKDLPLNSKFELDAKKISNETIHNSNHFDAVYTSLLKCLNSAFNNKPKVMTTCMGKMYELQNAGEKLVASPISRNRRDSGTYHPLPRWRFVPDPYKDQGIIVDGFVEQDNIGLKFC